MIPVSEKTIVENAYKGYSFYDTNELGHKKFTNLAMKQVQEKCVVII